MAAAKRLWRMLPGLATSAQFASAAPRGARIPSWSVAPAGAFGWALLVALALSTQYLFQPFVWANWPWDEVLLGWCAVLGDRVVVALSVALAVVANGRAWPDAQRVAGAAGRRWRAVRLALAIAVGAATGELALLVLHDQPASAADWPFAGRVAHWTLLAGSIVLTQSAWRRVAKASAEAQAEELRGVQLQRQVVQSRLQALRSQIEPHFLFNTLATVRRLHQADPAQGALLLRHFNKYLRLAIAEPASTASLARELDLVQAYIGVVDVRMSGRLHATFDVAVDLLDAELPPLTLATLVENAVKHGVGALPQGGTIGVRAQRAGERLELTVTDTGAGFSGTIGRGIGLANIRERLHALYGPAGELVLANHQPCGARVTMRLPLRRFVPS